MELSFIIVNYQSRHLLESCLASVRKNAMGLNYEIIVVNNDSAPLEFSNLDNTNLSILEKNSNIGFAQACNAGAQQAKGNFLFFLNPDTILLDLDLRFLLSLFKEPAVGVVAPCLIGEDNQVQEWTAGFSVTPLSILKNNLGHIASQQLWKTTGPTLEADWVSGGAFLVSRSLFEQIKGFDENFFLYFEDVDFCYRLKSLSKKILLVTTQHVKHFSGQSSSDSQLQKKHYYASQDYYLKKHFGYFQAFAIKLLRILYLGLTRR